MSLLDERMAERVAPTLVVEGDGGDGVGHFGEDMGHEPLLQRRLGIAASHTGRIGSRPSCRGIGADPQSRGPASGHFWSARDHPANHGLELRIQPAASTVEDDLVGGGPAPSLSKIVQPARHRECLIPVLAIRCVLA